SKPLDLYWFIHSSNVLLGMLYILAIDLIPPDSPYKYSSTSFILNSFVYFGIQKPLHPYSGFWGSGQDYLLLFFY
ncbi:MAG: hypothetical protein E6045_01475, partial [Finegoldia magna]|nr:hypothetical protein [Finegoldia magna]